MTPPPDLAARIGFSAVSLSRALATADEARRPLSTPTRALLAPFTSVEQLDFHDCVTLGAGHNAAGERVIFAATCDGDESSRTLHAVVDEAAYMAFRHGTLTWKSILEAAPFYLVETPYYIVESMVTEMTADQLAPQDRPMAESFCPAHARLINNSMERRQ